MDRIARVLSDLERFRDVGIINARSDKVLLQQAIDVVAELREKVAVLEERVAIMTEDEPGADTSFGPTEDQDFWDGTWPEIRGR